MNKKRYTILMLIICLCYLVYNEYLDKTNKENNLQASVKDVKSYYTLENIPEYNNEPYIILNNNIPQLDDLSKSAVSFEVYSELDSLDRCTDAYASIGKDLMPTEERKSIGSVKPTGWHTTKYDIVDGKYLYNRCHLIGFQLAGENANKNNLITCTRYMNTKGMLPFENEISEYVKKTNNHVLYRVTPIYKENNLLASGVHMQALSIEDNGEGIKYNVFIYNVQPGIKIDYKTGESSLIE